MSDFYCEPLSQMLRSVGVLGLLCFGVWLLCFGVWIVYRRLRYSQPDQDPFERAKREFDADMNRWRQDLRRGKKRG
jgi:hypothetical protein